MEREALPVSADPLYFKFEDGKTLYIYLIFFMTAEYSRVGVIITARLLLVYYVPCYFSVSY